MQTFYSIVYCPIRPGVDEKLSIAMFMRGGEQIYFRYSHDKLKIIKGLIPESAYRLLKGYLSNIKRFFDKKNVTNDEVMTLFEGIISKNYENFLEPQYFEYLNKYSNNLLHFSKPITLSLDVDEELFNKMYNKFIYSFDTNTIKRKSFYDSIKNKVSPKVENRVNIDFELTSKHIANLVIPTKVWLIGKNGTDVTGEIFDFNKNTYHLENDISKHLNLIQSLKDLDGDFGRHFIVGNEPDKSNYTNYSIWKELKGLKYIDYVSKNETQKISEYVIKKGVLPFVHLEEGD